MRAEDRYEYDGYGAVAPVYDRLNAEIDYTAWAAFAERCIEKFCRKRPALVLDLACGTGRMTIAMAERGYDMIGVDGSADMLAVAYDRAAAAGRQILFLQQDMRSFELYGTVGAVLCCLDSLNYLTGDGELALCFSLVHNYLEPDGLFFFDVNTPHKFACVYGDEAYILEDEEGGTFCGWQNRYDPESGLCEFALSVFTENKNGTYTRRDEVQTERCYTMEQITASLQAAGMELLGVYGDFAFTPADAAQDRWYFCARAIK